jgi:hypothetical protein
VKFKKINEILKRHHNFNENIWDSDSYLGLKYDGGYGRTEEERMSTNGEYGAPYNPYAEPGKDWFKMGRKPFEPFKVWGTTMTCNEEFFRSDTFRTDEDAIMFVGCSLTQGIGIDDEQLVWPWRVGKHFDMKVWNLGMGGMGESYMCWVATEYLHRLNPKAVCMLIPPPGRHHYFKPTDISWDEWWNNPFYHREMGENRGIDRRLCFTQKGLIKNVINSGINMMGQSLKEIMLVNSLCEEKGIPFIVESFDRWIDYEKHGNSDDNHPGPLYHEWVSEYFINELTRELEK